MGVATANDRALPGRRLRVALRLCAGAALGALLIACGGGAPRKATPPSREHDTGVRREKFWIPGVRDEWHEPPVIIRGLKELGGVIECEVDATDGKYVVVYNVARTTRDEIREKLIEIGEQNGRRFDPIFEDR